MTDQTPDDLMRRLERLAQLEPGEAATRHALERVEPALAQRPSPGSRTRSRWAMYARIAAAAALLTAAALAAVLLLAPASGGSAFADVQKKISLTKSVHMKGVTHDGTKEISMEMWIMADGRLRMQDAENITIVDTTKGRMLALHTKKKEALLVDSYHSPLPQNLYQVMRDLRKDSIRKLPAEKRHGRRVEVFVAQLENNADAMQWKVWVDPQTQLPIGLETARKDGNRMERSEITNMVFDGPVDESIFHIAVPADYKLNQFDGGQPKPAPNELLRLEAKPKIGLGPVKFGMSKADVINTLGEPDKIDQRGTALDYLSRGYTIMVSPTRGVLMINCISQKLFVVKVKDFAGKTTEGIALGSSMADVKKAYGDPSAIEDNMGTLYLTYADFGLHFIIAGDQVLQFTLSPVHKK